MYIAGNITINRFAKEINMKFYVQNVPKQPLEEGSITPRENKWNEIIWPQTDTLWKQQIRYNITNTDEGEYQQRKNIDQLD